MLEIYLETTVPNFLFCTDSPDKRAATEDLFELIREGRFQAFVSELFLDEVSEVADDFLRYQLDGVVKVYSLEVLSISAENYELADAYVEAGAFTEKAYFDALHVALAVHAGCDRVVSWNFQHIVRHWTIQRVNEVNLKLGLGPVVICTPEEVIHREVEGI